MAVGKGGARHFAKPHVDEGLLLKVLSSNAEIVGSMGAYESVSKSQACNPQGLIRVLPLVKGLLRLEPTCEVHPGNLRSALLNLLMQEPALNQTKFNGNTWCNTRLERLGVILSHFRRLRLSDDLRACASKLTSCDFLRLQSVVESIVVKAETNKERPPEKRLPAAKGEELEEGPPKRRLSAKVSLDSDGWPKCFQEESLGEGALVKGSGDEALASAEETAVPALPEARQPHFLKRRVGRLAKAGAAANPSLDGSALRATMGFSPCEKGKKGKARRGRKKKSSGPAALRKPAASEGLPPCKKPAAKESFLAAERKGILQKRKPWVKLKVTYASKPERAYIQGCSGPGEKKRLIVEVSRYRSELYREHIETLYKLLQDEHLTKAEAMEMKEELCNNE